MSCGCERRQSRLNGWWPGLGDAVKAIADPIRDVLLWVRDLLLRRRT